MRPPSQHWLPRGQNGEREGTFSSLGVNQRPRLFAQRRKNTRRNNSAWREPRAFIRRERRSRPLTENLCSSDPSATGYRSRGLRRLSVRQKNPFKLGYKTAFGEDLLQPRPFASSYKNTTAVGCETSAERLRGDVPVRFLGLRSWNKDESDFDSPAKKGFRSERLEWNRSSV